MHGELNLMTLGMAILDTLLATVCMFVMCELGQRVSNAFEEILDEFDKFNWHKFPLEISRSLPMILAAAQEPVELEMFASISCCREVLKKVSCIDSFSFKF